MSLDTSQLQDFLVCQTCKQFCPTRHPEIERWFDWHVKNCRPRSSQVRTTGQAEPYVPWLQSHVKMSNEILEGYQCAISDIELLALMGQPRNGSQGPQGFR